MIGKNIPDRILEEFMDSIKKSSLFDDVLAERLKKLIKSEKGISRKDLLDIISSGVG